MCNHRQEHLWRQVIFVTVLGVSVLIWSQAFAWQTILNNSEGPDLFRAVAIDSANNIVGAGETTRTNGGRGFVVAKFSGLDGALLWRVELDGTDVVRDDEANAVMFDGNDDVIAVGRIANVGTFFDFTVVKLAGSSGGQLWLRTIDGEDDVARAVAIDNANNVVVAGRITDAVTSGNFAVIKFSGIDGATQWTWTTTGDAQTVLVNSLNDIIAGGFTNVGFAVVKLTSNGGLVWRQEIQHPACCLDTARSVEIDSHGDIFAAGNRNQGFAAVKLSGNTGAVLWSRQIDGPGISGEQANRVAVDPNDDVVVAGFINKGTTGAYRYAIRWGWANKNPLAGLSLNQEGEGRLRWLTREEESRLLLACASWLQDMVIVGLDTGLRRANLVGLHRAWLYHDGTVLIIPRQNIKLKKSAVTIPLTTRAAKIIHAHCEASTSPYLFIRQDGTPYSHAAVSTAFIRSARHAGFHDVSLHTLRHTFVSRLVQAGRPLAEVAHWLGIATYE